MPALLASVIALGLAASPPAPEQLHLLDAALSAPVGAGGDVSVPAGAPIWQSYAFGGSTSLILGGLFGALATFGGAQLFVTDTGIERATGARVLTALGAGAVLVPALSSWLVTVFARRSGFDPSFARVYSASLIARAITALGVVILSAASNRSPTYGLWIAVPLLGTATEALFANLLSPSAIRTQHDPAVQVAP